MLFLQSAILNYVKELENHHPPEWDAMPDIDLYMDQVITYLERQVSFFSMSDEEKHITPAMINNYVKNEIIPRPLKKKYNREHLAHLMAILNLKQVMSLSDIKTVINLESLDKSIESIYNLFNSIQHDTLQNASTRVLQAIELINKDEPQEEVEKRLRMLAIKLSLEANANRIIAKRILDEIVAHQSKNDEEKEKVKEKEKEKDKVKSNNK